MFSKEQEAQASTIIQNAYRNYKTRFNNILQKTLTNPDQILENLLNELKINKSSCSICQDDFKLGAVVANINCDCSAILHKDCLDDFVSKGNNPPPKCPNCRQIFTMAQITSISAPIEELIIFGNSWVPQLISKGARLDVCSDGTLLHKAASTPNFNIKIMQALLDSGIDINNRQEDGSTALLCACVNGHTETAIWLLEKGANPNLCHTGRFSPLFYAAKKGNSKLTSELLRHGADARICIAVQNCSPLFKAVESEDIETVRILLTEGRADPNVVVAPGGDNPSNCTSPLFKAVERRNIDIVKLLLDHHANPQIALIAGTTPIFKAAERGDSEILAALLPYVETGDVNNSEKDGATPLFMAAKNGHLSVIQMLLQVPGINVNSVRLVPTNTTINGVRVMNQRTPLAAAICNRNFEIALKLINDKRVNVNQPLSTLQSNTALHEAIREQSLQLIEALLTRETPSIITRDIFELVQEEHDKALREDMLKILSRPASQKKPAALKNLRS